MGLERGIAKASHACRKRALYFSVAAVFVVVDPYRWCRYSHASPLHPLKRRGYHLPPPPKVKSESCDRYHTLSQPLRSTNLYTSFLIYV
jgi:hypothetical protein